MQLAAFLCVICVICGRIHASLLNLYCTNEPQCLPQISLIYADKPQNHTNLTNCLSLRNNAACCIPLRDLRYLRENIHIRVLNQSPKKNPQYLSQTTQISADKMQKLHTPSVSQLPFSVLFAWESAVYIYSNSRKLFPIHCVHNLLFPPVFSLCAIPVN